MLWFGSSHKQLGNVGVVLNPRILVVREEKEDFVRETASSRESQGYIRQGGLQENLV